MKKMMRALAVLLAVMMLAGCGSASSETQEETNSAMNETEAESETLSRGEFTASDYVTVSKYEGLEISESDITPTEDDIQEKIDSLVSGAAELTEVDRAAKDGDTVNIDYVGKKDGEEFDGGSDTDYDLELGSDTFIDGFEDGLVGAKAGDTVTLNLTFPDTYSNSDLAGQDVTFDVTVNAVKESVEPEYNDELIQEQTDYDTVEEYEEAITADMKESNLETAIYDALYENSTFADELPESLTNYYQQTYANYYDSMFSNYYGTTLDEYLESCGMTRDDFYTAVGVPNFIKDELIWRYIADKEGFTIGSDDYNSFVDDLAEQYSAESADDLIEQYGEETVEYEYIYESGYDLVKNSVVYK